MLACQTIFAVAALMLAPWILRNYRVQGAFVPFTTQTGTALVDANNRIVATQPEYYGFALSWERQIPEYVDLYSSVSNEVNLSNMGVKLYKQWMRANPDKWWYLTESKFRRFWTPFLQQSNQFNRFAMLLSWGTVLILFTGPFLVTLYRGLSNRRSAPNGSLCYSEHPGELTVLWWYSAISIPNRRVLHCVRGWRRIMVVGSTAS